MKATCIPYTFHFLFPAGTSRGILNEKKAFFIILEENDIYGIGECSVIPGLSLDDRQDYEKRIAEVCSAINSGIPPMEIDLDEFPSIAFGLETAWIDLNRKGRRLLFPSRFTNGQDGILINGLIWMGSKEFIAQQIKDKLNAGFRCLKLKIGSLSFQTETEILSAIRKNFQPNELEIRLDANGAFLPGQALEKLKILSGYSIHSIEQPIMHGQLDVMAMLIENSPIPVALDEELIRVSGAKQKENIISELKPAYIIIKPSLLGGFKKAGEWIHLTKGTDTKWWITSALESNIGLNAIAQWTYSLSPSLPQGLGTGRIYSNNIPSPLYMEGDYLKYNPEAPWDLSSIHDEYL